VDQITLGPDMLKEMEHEVAKIKQNLKVTQIDKRAMLTEIKLIGSSKWETMSTSGLIPREVL
jgi:hypothetical protein